jgi:hypothetical protein
MNALARARTCDDGVLSGDRQGSKSGVFDDLR